VLASNTAAGAMNARSRSYPRKTFRALTVIGVRRPAWMSGRRLGVRAMASVHAGSAARWSALPLWQERCPKRSMTVEITEGAGFDREMPERT
jgi:hypothetical protein